MKILMDSLKNIHCSLNNKLYSQLEKQVNNQLWVRLYVARIDRITSTLQTTIQTQFNTLLYTEEELNEDELNRVRILENALNRSGYTTITDFSKSTPMTHVEKYNN